MSFSHLLISALLGFTVSPALTAQGFEHHKLLPTNGVASALFGSAVATDGVLIAIGAAGANQLGATSGSAYVFDATNANQIVELIPATGAPGDQLGTAIAIDDGFVVVGAPFADGVGTDSGAAYVFDATSGLELFKLEPADAAAGNQFGYSVAMDGNLAVVGTLGAAYLFDVSTGQELVKLLPTGASTTFGLSGFGEAVAIDAGTVVVGARLENGVSGFAGAAYVFDASSGSQLHRLLALDGTTWANFGASVAIDGDLVAIGAPEASPIIWHAGAAYLFDALTGQQTLKILPGDGHLQAKFGSSVDVDGLHVVIGSEKNNASGAFSSGAAYLFEAPGGNFVQKLQASDAAPHDRLGGAVAASNGVFVAGAARDDDNGTDSGSAYVFDAAGTVTTMAQCHTNAGSLTHVGGIAVAGQTLTFRMDSAQSGTAWALLAVATGPVPGWPNCGVNLGSTGELLIDTPLISVAAPWSGLAADFPVSLPSQSGLVGFPLYLQGVFIAPTSTPEPLRLTGGLELLLGGYR
tara:strand:+ start:105151 stop:106716 length:1566 start_codon:yes stop_codon:yes gene_type:complete